MEYISNMNKLFAIKCECDIFCILGPDYFIDKQRECGGYDFKQNEWKKIAPFKYKWNETNQFVCITAYDTRLNVIYMQSNNGYTAKYDCNKDEWTVLVYEKLEDVIEHRISFLGKLWVEGVY